MELTALKGVMKEMGIKFEKFHTRTAPSQKAAQKTAAKPALRKKKED